MAAGDWLGPQWDNLTEFDPSGQVWGGSAFSYSRLDSTGKVTRNSRNTANMKGRSYAADAKDQLPAGHSTDFTVKGMQQSNDQTIGTSARFVPNEQEKSGPGAWN